MTVKSFQDSGDSSDQWPSQLNHHTTHTNPPGFEPTSQRSTFPTTDFPRSHGNKPTTTYPSDRSPYSTEPLEGYIYHKADTEYHHTDHNSNLSSARDSNNSPLPALGHNFQNSDLKSSDQEVDPGVEYSNEEYNRYRVEQEGYSRGYPHQLTRGCSVPQRLLEHYQGPAGLIEGRPQSSLTSSEQDDLPRNPGESQQGVAVGGHPLSPTTEGKSGNHDTSQSLLPQEDVEGFFKSLQHQHTPPEGAGQHPLSHQTVHRLHLSSTHARSVTDLSSSQTPSEGEGHHPALAGSPSADSLDSFFQAEERRRGKSPAVDQQSPSGLLEPEDLDPSTADLDPLHLQVQQENTSLQKGRQAHCNTSEAVSGNTIESQSSTLPHSHDHNTLQTSTPPAGDHTHLSHLSYSHPSSSHPASHPPASQSSVTGADPHYTLHHKDSDTHCDNTQEKFSQPVDTVCKSGLSGESGLSHHRDTTGSDTQSLYHSGVNSGSPSDYTTDNQSIYHLHHRESESHKDNILGTHSTEYSGLSDLHHRDSTSKSSIDTHSVLHTSAYNSGLTRDSLLHHRPRDFAGHSNNSFGLSSMTGHSDIKTEYPVGSSGLQGLYSSYSPHQVGGISTMFQTGNSTMAAMHPGTTPGAYPGSDGQGFLHPGTGAAPVYVPTTRAMLPAYAMPSNGASSPQTSSVSPNSAVWSAMAGQDAGNNYSTTSTHHATVSPRFSFPPTPSPPGMGSPGSRAGETPGVPAGFGSTLTARPTGLSPYSAYMGTDQFYQFNTQVRTNISFQPSTKIRVNYH